MYMYMFAYIYLYVYVYVYVYIHYVYVYIHCPLLPFPHLPHLHLPFWTHRGRAPRYDFQFPLEFAEFLSVLGVPGWC